MTNQDIKKIRKGLKEALKYIGNDRGGCPVCGGDGKTLAYHKSCPCLYVREALTIINKK